MYNQAPHLDANYAALNCRMHGSNIHKNSFRQISIVKEWKDRYFPERQTQELFWEWIFHAIRQSREEGNLRNYSELFKIVDDLLLHESDHVRSNVLSIVFKADAQLDHEKRKARLLKRLEKKVRNFVRGK